MSTENHRIASGPTGLYVHQRILSTARAYDDQEELNVGGFSGAACATSSKPHDSGPAVPSSRQGATTAAATVPPNDQVSLEDLWQDIDQYLLAAYVTLQNYDERAVERLRAPQNRMRRYTIIYSACNGNPATAREFYVRLALTILHILEVRVLFPALRTIDQRRLRVVTGREDTSGALEEAAASARPGRVRRSRRLHSRTFVQRLLFRDDSSSSVGSSNSSLAGTGRSEATTASPRASAPATPNAHRHAPSAPSSLVTIPNLKSHGPPLFTGGDTSSAARGNSSPLLSTAVQGGKLPAAPKEETAVLSTAAPIACYGNCGSVAGVRGGLDGICGMFNEEYSHFVAFRRLVLSCFSYLDQYYTKRFGMDTITVMCVKLFYVVVYEPLRPLIMSEVHSTVRRIRDSIGHRGGGDCEADIMFVQKTLGFRSELITAVHSTSSYLVAGVTEGGQTASSPAAATSISKPIHSMSGQRGGGTASSGILEGSTATAAPHLSDGGAASSPRQRVTGAEAGDGRSRSRLFSFFSSSGQSHEETSTRCASAPASPSTQDVVMGSAQSGMAGTERPQRAASAQSGFEESTDPDIVVSLRGATELRSRLESYALSKIQATHCVRQHESLHYQTRGTAEADRSVGTLVKEVAQPLPTLIMEDLGDSLIASVEDHYKCERAAHITTTEMVRGYIAWLRVVWQVEFQLIKKVALPSFHTAVGATLRRVLVAEVHRTIILDEASGFVALLEVWDGTRTDDGLIAAILEDRWDGATPTRSPPPPPATHQQRQLQQSSTSLSALQDCAEGPRLSAGCALGQGTSGLFTQASRTMYDEETRAGTPPELCSNRHVSSMLMRVSPCPAPVRSGAGADSGGGRVGRCGAEQRTERALGVFFSVFDLDDESCVLLLASLTAAKVIRDAAAHIRNYLKSLSNASMAQPVGRRPPGGGPGRAGRLLDPSASLPPPEAVAGDTLIASLLGLSARYTRLIETQFNGNSVVRGALSDALSEILNPDHWSNSGSLAASTQRARGAMLLSGIRLPSVLLSRDAGARATAPLVALSALPGAATVDMQLLLANYYDHMCQRELSGAVVDGTSTLSNRPQHLAVFVSLLDSKDAFLAHYKGRLARRLLGPAGAVNTEAERLMVQQLQLQLGVSAMHSFELMLRDFDITEMAAEGFRETDGYKQLETKIQVRVLTSSQWPTYRLVSLTPHSSLQRGIDVFRSFYSSLHPSRTLHWLHVLGTATLTGEFPRGNKEIVASTLQASILLAVSDATNSCESAEESLVSADNLQLSPGSAMTSSQWEDLALPSLQRSTTEGSASVSQSFYSIASPTLDACSGSMDPLNQWSRTLSPRGVSGQDIAERVGMAFTELRPHLHSVTLNRPLALVTRVSSSAGAEPDPAAPLEPEDIFTLNKEFTHRMRKVRLPLPRQQGHGGPHPSQQRRVSGDADVSEEIRASRRRQLDTVIVRIMKSRWVLSYVELAAMTTQQVSSLFIPTTRDIKAQVSDLVSRGYLQRKGDDSFEYVA